MQEANCVVRNLVREVILKIHGFVVRGVAVKRGQVGVVETRERWSMRHTFHSLFHPGLKPSFSANLSHRSLSFSSSGLTTWISPTFTVTSEHIHFLLFRFFSVLHFLVFVSVR